MKQAILPLGTALAALTLVGDAPAQPISAETLAALDPSRLGASFCGSPRAGKALRERLKLAASVTSAGQPQTAAPIAVPDSIRFAASSADPEVGRHVREGLLLAYGFNHDAAIAAFREAQRLDPGLRDLLLGRGLCARPQHQRADDARGDCRRRVRRSRGRWRCGKAPRRPSGR